MPIYDYRCDCGTHLTLSRAIVARDARVDCQHCGGRAVRMVSAPRLATLSTATRRAHGINEQSADAPRHVRRAAPVPDAPAAAGHTAHAHAHRHGPQRPWMLGH